MTGGPSSSPSTESPPDAPDSLALLLAGQPRLEEALAGAERAAASRAPILILGEQGTGRTRLARALHAASPVAAAPLVEVDPGTIPATLFESDLFGWRPGAFTGAADASPGRLGRAEGGSLLLDHVEEIPLGSQAKLLRLLSEGTYAPLGGRERRARVRFLAVGPDDLRERVRRGAFREDLYYRLEVLAFRLPPLRERRADLPAVFDQLLDDLGRRLGRPALTLADDARAWMLDHPWPGNLRQVKNILERAAILADPGTPLVPTAPKVAGGPPPSLEEVERETIRRALTHTRGHQGKAAEILGISRKTLWEKRKRHGLP